MEKKVTQTASVLKHLKEHGSLTSLEAIHRWTATRLSGIIFNLRKKHFIDTEIIPIDGGRYGRYHYKGEKFVIENWSKETKAMLGEK